MIEAARAGGRRGASTSRSPTCATGRRAEPVDVLVSNATLQWVPDHLDLLPRLVARSRPGGWLAFQVPGNFDEPSHTHPSRARRRAAVRRAHPRRRGAREPRPGDYLEALVGLGLRGRRVGDDLPARADRRRTRSSPGCPAPAPDRPCRRCRLTCAPTSRWSSSSGSRDAYPVADGRVVLPFRRVFVVARASHEAPPRAGRLPARWRGRRAPVLRRRAGADRGREA